MECAAGITHTLGKLQGVQEKPCAAVVFAQLLNSLTQECPLDPGVWGYPWQHNKEEERRKRGEQEGGGRREEGGEGEKKTQKAKMSLLLLKLDS